MNKQTEQILNDLLLERGQIKSDLAEIDAELQESRVLYHEHGITSPPGFYPTKKREQARLRSDLEIVSTNIASINRKLTAEHRKNIAEFFIQVAREKLDRIKWHEILDEAERRQNETAEVVND